jgi:lipid-binding SYLF domain-containing protein
MKATLFSMFSILLLGLVGCESTPVTPTNAMPDRAKIALEQMEAADPTLRHVVETSYAIAVFPEVGKAAVGIGGGGGKGVVYRNGEVIGYAMLNEGSVGLQAGGGTFAELVAFETPEAYQTFQKGNLTLGADASATIIKAGAAASGNFAKGIRIFVMPKGGLMAGVSIVGQKFSYSPTPFNGNM